MSQHQGNWRIDHYTSTTTRKEQSRSGTTTSMVEEWSEPVSQDKIVSTSLIHTMRGRDIDIIYSGYDLGGPIDRSRSLWRTP